MVESNYSGDCRDSASAIMAVKGGEPVPSKGGINWEQRRYELAKAAMQGILSNGQLIDNGTAQSTKWVYEHSIAFADALINQLKGARP